MLGTATERQATSPPERAGALADMTVMDHEGDQVRLGDLWKERPAALVWIRHYGCAHCRDHAMRLGRAHREFQNAGIDLVLIGQATPRHAAHFRRRMGVDLPVLADEKRETYRAAGAKVATMGELLGPRSVSRGLARTIETRGKVRQGRIIGHPAQLGGAMVVTPDSQVVWSHMSEDASDNATPEELLDAAKRAASSA